MGAPGWAIEALSDPSLLDARKQSAARILDLFDANLADRFDYSALMAREFRSDRNLALDELERWFEIIRDIAMVQNGLRQHVVFDDRLEELDRVAQGLTPDDVSATVSVVEKTRHALMVNAYPPLAFDGMMLGLPGVRIK